MNSERDDTRRPFTLEARLRREARRSSGDFSPVFHERLMSRIAREAVEPTMIRQPDLLPRPGHRMPLALSIVAAGLASLAMAVVVASWLPGHLSARLQPVDSGTEDALAATEDGGTGAGIESIPMYDDIDVSMRAGVWMIASSVVELPDWARLADFDATAVLDEASVP